LQAELASLSTIPSRHYAKVILRGKRVGAWLRACVGPQSFEGATMKATAADRARLEEEIARLAEQLRAMGAQKVVLFGSLARGEISLFSDIDLLVSPPMVNSPLVAIENSPPPWEEITR
jgi:hypothetical protein